jgi:RNA polymerase sporulation-specific sigma factor
LTSAWSLDQPGRDANNDGSWLDSLPGNHEPSPELFVTDQETSFQLIQTLKNELTPLERLVFDARRRGKSYDEISRTVKRPRKTIDNALQRIRRKLKKTRKGI